jgi:uncharacterized membrane protein YqgA involved in biofilm formation
VRGRVVEGQRGGLQAPLVASFLRDIVALVAAAILAATYGAGIYAAAIALTNQVS